MVLLDAGGTGRRVRAPRPGAAVRPAGAVPRRARASEIRVAQQLGILANLPSVAVTTLIALNGIRPSLTVALGGAVVLLVLNGLGWRVTSAMFDRERLITGAR